MFLAHPSLRPSWLWAGRRRRPSTGRLSAAAACSRSSAWARRWRGPRQLVAAPPAGAAAIARRRGLFRRGLFLHFRRPMGSRIRCEPVGRARRAPWRVVRRAPLPRRIVGTGPLRMQPHSSCISSGPPRRFRLAVPAALAPVVQRLRHPQRHKVAESCRLVLRAALVGRVPAHQSSLYQMSPRIVCCVEDLSDNVAT